MVWGFAITNYVWWIGIGHVGHFHFGGAAADCDSRWRTSINRFAEAMTIFAARDRRPVSDPALGPALVLLLADAVSERDESLWPQWRSPLVWDFFAIWPYLIVSLLFWYLGLMPDLATLRDRARARGTQIAYGLLALGWRGEARHWQRRQRRAYLLLAGLAVPLVVSVHSVVSSGFRHRQYAGLALDDLSAVSSSPARCSPASPWR